MPESRPNVFDLTPEELGELAAGWGWPRFRAGQILKWVYEKGVLEPERMTDLSAPLRRELPERLDLSAGEIKADQLSRDGTHKLLITWSEGSPAPKPPAEQSEAVDREPGRADRPAPEAPRAAGGGGGGGGAEAETVMIPDDSRRTACVSSQVGCPVGCRFCASGVAGLKQNLSAGRILQQVWHLNRALRERGDAVGRVTNLVFMGMGEPLANYPQVIRAVRMLHDPAIFNMGWRRMTLSTVGVPPRMRQLADEDIPINLALSLHAPEEHLRRQIIPWAEHFELNDILEACRYYFEKTGREITFEYILLSGVNDQPKHAKRLATICRTGGFRVNVNLLRYNEVAGLPYQRPDSRAVMQFQSILRESGVNAHVRKSRGRDIDAACGQLRRKQTAADVPELVQLSAGARS